MAAKEDIKDPCAIEEPAHRWAFVWFASVLVIGICLTYFLADVDGQLWDSKGRFLDYKRYEQNRVASTSIPSERIDERQRSSLTAAIKMLDEN